MDTVVSLSACARSYNDAERKSHTILYNDKVLLRRNERTLNEVLLTQYLKL